MYSFSSQCLVHIYTLILCQQKNISYDKSKIGDITIQKTQIFSIYYHFHRHQFKKKNMFKKFLLTNTYSINWIFWTWWNKFLKEFKKGEKKYLHIFIINVLPGYRDSISLACVLTNTSWCDKHHTSRHQTIFHNLPTVRADAGYVRFNWTEFCLEVR